VGITSDVCKINGNFFKQMLHVIRDRISDFCVADETGTSGLTIGVTLGKNGSEAAGVVTIEANSTWLVSGATVILNFLKESMPRMGPATAACKNFAVKSLP
jgi:hypothetical protein